MPHRHLRVIQVIEYFHLQNVGSDDLNYAGLSFLPRAEQSRRPARERELEPNVVYASTMHSRNHRS